MNLVVKRRERIDRNKESKFHIDRKNDSAEMEA